MRVWLGEGVPNQQVYLSAKIIWPSLAEESSIGNPSRMDEQKPSRQHELDVILPT